MTERYKLALSQRAGDGYMCTNHPCHVTKATMDNDSKIYDGR